MEYLRVARGEKGGFLVKGSGVFWGCGAVTVVDLTGVLFWAEMGRCVVEVWCWRG